MEVALKSAAMEAVTSLVIPIQSRGLYLVLLRFVWHKKRKQKVTGIYEIQLPYHFFRQYRGIGMKVA
jgi:hypothetical protein